MHKSKPFSWTSLTHDVLVFFFFFKLNKNLVCACTRTHTHPSRQQVPVGFDLQLLASSMSDPGLKKIENLSLSWDVGALNVLFFFLCACPFLGFLYKHLFMVSCVCLNFCTANLLWNLYWAFLAQSVDCSSFTGLILFVLHRC